MNVPPWEPAPFPFLYEQVAGHIAARIGAGDLPAGSRLPRETELAAQYGVAYHTVRGAIRILRDRGLVVTYHGRGNYVAGQPDGPVPGHQGTEPSGDQGG
jgi:DNA-binding GntR family transcriptional regulator